MKLNIVVVTEEELQQNCRRLPRGIGSFEGLDAYLNPVENGEDPALPVRDFYAPPFGMGDEERKVE